MENEERFGEESSEIFNTIEEAFMQWESGNLSYYELTEAIHQFHMRKL